MSRARLATAAFGLGVAIMLFLEPARIVGVALLLGGLAVGVFAIATDDFVAGDEDAGQE